jgi:mannose-6-phosphate isomerase-like protein (cupin superfamily)
MDYVIKNVRDVEDMAPKFGFGDLQEARFPWRDLEAQQTGMAVIRVKPEQRQPFAHRHHEAEEIYFVLSGSGRIKLDDAVEHVHAYDAIRIAPGVGRALEAGPDGLEVLAFGPHHEGESEMVEDFWG